MKPLELIFGLLRIANDYLLAITAFFLAYHLRLTGDMIPGIQLPITASTFPEYSQYLTTSSVTSLILIIILAGGGIYSLKRPASLNKQITKILAGTLIWLFSIITYYFLIRTFPFSRLALINTWFLAFLLISLGRIILQCLQNTLYNRGFAQTRVLLIGYNEPANDFLKNFFQSPQFYCVGYLNHIDHNINQKFLGNITNLEEVIEKNQVEKIIQVRQDLTENQETMLLEFCREKHLEFSFLPSQVEMQRTNIEIETIAGIPLLTLKPTPLDGWGRIIKRSFDFIGAICGIVLLSPIMIITAILIKLDDPKGTIIFKFLDDGSRVKRVGQKGRLFNFYKFRSMKPNTHNLRYSELAHLDTRQGTPMVKIKNDPRITKIGSFIRKTSIDELPQLFNVLKGEMSLVGPRPHLPEEVAKYQKHHKFVLTLKPGITGMAQISGRSDLDFEKEVKLDTYYIENWSLLLDLKILIKTILVIFKRYEE